MPTSTVRVPTANAQKYMTQLCKHWSHKLDVELGEATGIVRFGQAAADMTAQADGLVIRLTAESGEVLERTKSVLASHLDRFAFREAPLTFDWS